MVEDKKKFILPQLTNKNKSNTQIGSTKTSSLAKQVSSDKDDKDDNALDDLFKEVFNETESDYLIELEENLDRTQKEESLKNDIESNLSSLKDIDKKVQNLDETTHVIKDKLQNIYKEQKEQISQVEQLQLREEQSKEQSNTNSLEK